MEEAAFREAGGLADLIDRGRGKALGEHQLLGCFKQFLFRRGLSLSRSHYLYLPVGMLVQFRPSCVNPGVSTIDSVGECC
jgi:hypothetical protein